MSAIDDELDYISFRTSKMLALPWAGIVGHFGSARAEKMEARYQAEVAAGLIRQDYHDHAKPCGTCGRKHCGCRPLTMSEWRRECR